MSFYDEIRTGMTEVFDVVFVAATITRTTEALPSLEDRAAGRKGATTTISIPARGALGERSLKLEDGTIVRQSVARLTISVLKKDRITIGSRTFEVTESKDVTPDGLSPIIAIAVLK